MQRTSLTCSYFKDLLSPHASKFHHRCKDDSSKRKASYSALSRSVSEPPVVGFVKTGSPAITVAWPVPIESRNKCNHVSSSHNKPRSSTEGRREGGRDVSRESPSVCVPTSRISERYVVDSLPHGLNLFCFRCRASREIPLDMYSAHISLVSCGIYAPFLFPVSTQLCILIGARGLLSPLLHRSRSLKPSGLPSPVISIGNTYIYGQDVAVITKLINKANIVHYSLFTVFFNSQCFI